jgi:hypothetical protein
MIAMDAIVADLCPVSYLSMFSFPAPSLSSCLSLDVSSYKMAYFHLETKAAGRGWGGAN